MKIRKLHGPLALASAASWLLSGIFQLANCATSSLTFTLIAGVTGVCAYFAGAKNEKFLTHTLKALEAEQAGRQLDPAQRDSLKANFLGIAKSADPINLTGLQGDREAICLANVLKELLEEGGFVIDGVWEDILLGGTGPGILVRQEAQDGALGVALTSAFQHVGLAARIVALGDRSKGKLEIIVGYRP